MKRLLFFITCLNIPLGVSALTSEERLAKFNELPIIEQNGEKVLNTKIVDPTEKFAKECVFTEEDYKKEDSKNPGFFESTGMTSEKWIENSTRQCKDRIMFEMIGTYLRSLGYEFNSNSSGYMIDSFLFDNEMSVRLSYTDENNENTPMENPLKIKFIENKDEYKIGKEKLNAFGNEYSMFGLDVINSVYHYGLTNDDAYFNDALIARYGNVKDIFESEKEYKYVNYYVGGGGAPYYATFTSSVGVMKDGILYDVKEITFKEYNIVYVDKNETGTIFEKAERRLNEYFKNEVIVKVDGSLTWVMDGDEIDEIINDNLGTKDVHYEGHYAEIKIGNTSNHIVIVEIPKDKLDSYSVSSKDIDSGVIVNTNSYEVPLDARVNAKNVTDNEYVKKAGEENNLNIKSAYDITLNKMFDNKLITQIKNGIEVLLPLNDDYNVNEEIQVYYISDDGKSSETINGVVVIQDGKKYAKFKTTHFSTYALASKKDDNIKVVEITNPATGDNLIKNILISMSSLGLIGIVVILKKKVFK